MKKLVRNMKDPESRAFWLKLEERVKAYNKNSPHWLRCDGTCKRCKTERWRKEKYERKT